MYEEETTSPLLFIFLLVLALDPADELAVAFVVLELPGRHPGQSSRHRPFVELVLDVATL